MQRLPIERERGSSAAMKIISTGPFLFPSVAQSAEHVLISSGADIGTVYRQQGVQFSEVHLLAVQDASEDQQPPLQHLLRGGQCLKSRRGSIWSFGSPHISLSHLQNKNVLVWFHSQIQRPKKCYFIFRTPVFSFWNTPLGQLPQNFPTWWQLMAKKKAELVKSILILPAQVLY